MRLGKTSSQRAEGDMTPMIDMVFQLIAFFMVLINFTETEIDQRVQLPSSQLAKPPDGPLEMPIYIHVTPNGTAVIGGEEIALAQVHRQLTLETAIMARKNESPADATVIIRADREAQAGQVQDLIQMCQQAGFERFALRAEEQLVYPTVP